MATMFHFMITANNANFNDMELTNDIVEDLGFKRINSSMWRRGNITLRNIRRKKSYKVCLSGKYLCMENTAQGLLEIIEHFE